MPAKCAGRPSWCSAALVRNATEVLYNLDSVINNALTADERPTEEQVMLINDEETCKHNTDHLSNPKNYPVNQFCNFASSQILSTSQLRRQE
jgi:hypothetical protein